MPSSFDETAGERWLRRALTGPALLIATALYAAASPLLLALAALHDRLRSRPWLSVRFVVAVGGALVLHVAGLVGMAGVWLVGGRWTGRGVERERRLEQRLQVAWAQAIWWMAAHLYRLELDVDGDEALAAGPTLVLSRHTSLLDTLLPMVVLAARHGVRLRYVMKRELLWDPCLDAFGHRWPTAFVRRGTGDGREVEHVAALVDGLGPGDAIVVFPEGTRFSAAKQARVRARLRADPEAHARALRLQHVLPVHPRGPLALLAAAPALDVVFCAHTGLEAANHLADLRNGALLGRTVRVQLRRVRRADIPADAAARRAWLTEEWERLDRAIASGLTRTCTLR